jgi:hypothetical protein
MVAHIEEFNSDRLVYAIAKILIAVVYTRYKDGVGAGKVNSIEHLGQGSAHLYIYCNVAIDKAKCDILRHFLPLFN